MTVTAAVLQKASVFVTAIHIHSSLIFADKARSLPEWEPLMGLHFNGGLLALPSNIRLG